MSDAQVSDELHWMSAVELAAAIRRRDVSSVEVLDHFVERIRELDGPVNAVVRWDLERAGSAALAKVPVGSSRLPSWNCAVLKAAKFRKSRPSLSALPAVFWSSMFAGRTCTCTCTCTRRRICY